MEVSIITCVSLASDFTSQTTVTIFLNGPNNQMPGLLQGFELEDTHSSVPGSYPSTEAVTTESGLWEVAVLGLTMEGVRRVNWLSRS